MAGGDVTPLPRRELTVLCGLVACAMFSFAVIYPFLPFLVGWYLPQLEDHQFGFFAGYLGSAFNLGSIFAAFFWGRLADAIGRRPVFLICIAALAIGMLGFAFSPSFWVSVGIRFVSGTFMGIPAVAQTYMADICDETNMATAFSMFGMIRGCVLVVGPALGGFLVRPAEKFGGVFDNELLRAYPFCLPILVGCFGLTMSFVGVLLLLPETLVPPPPPLRQALGKLCGRGQDRKKYQQLEMDEAALVDESVGSEPELPPERRSCMAKLGCVLLKERKVFLACSAATLIAIVQMGSQEVFALWVLVEPSKGGFGFDATDIASISSIAGAMMPPAQMLLFPPFCRKFGAKKTAMAVMTTQAVTCCLLPLTAPFDSGADDWLAFVLVVVGYCCVQVTNSMSMTVTGMLTANAARTRERGTVMGLQQMMSSVGRTTGPAGGALMIAWSLEGRGEAGEAWAPRAFPFDYHFTWFCAAATSAAAVGLMAQMPGSIDRKMDESPRE